MLLVCGVCWRMTLPLELGDKHPSLIQVLHFIGYHSGKRFVGLGVTCQPGAHAPYAPGTGYPRMPCSDGPHAHFQGLCRPPPAVLLRVGMHSGCKHLQGLGGSFQGCVVELRHHPGVSTACPQDFSWRKPRSGSKGVEVMGCRLGAHSIHSYAALFYGRQYFFM